MPLDIGDTLSAPVAGMDTAKVAGLLVLGAIGVMALLRRGFGGISVRLDD